METKQIVATPKDADKSEWNRMPDFKSFDGRYSAWTSQSKAGNPIIRMVDNWKKDEGHPNPVITLIQTLK